MVLGRILHQQGIYPAIDVLPCLSRLMNSGIGKGKTRDDHKPVSNQLYASYAEGRDLRGLVSVVGEEALSTTDKAYLKFAEQFEQKFIKQGPYEDRSIERTLDIGWELMSAMPAEELTRIEPALREKYLKKK